jgi:hypothetical protein
MRVLSERRLAVELGALAGTPRVVAGGNYATPWRALSVLDVLGLAKAGALDPGQPVTASFAFGSADLYAWLDRNQDVRMLRTETVNDPARIAPGRGWSR